jgi:hypothetical protein
MFALVDATLAAGERELVLVAAQDRLAPRPGALRPSSCGDALAVVGAYADAGTLIVYSARCGGGTVIDRRR